MGFFDIGQLVRRIKDSIKNRKPEEHEVNMDDVKNIPPEIYEKIKSDEELVKIYLEVEENTRKILDDAILQGKIFDKTGLRRVLRRVIKQGDEDDFLILLNYYTEKYYGKEFTELSDGKQEQVLMKILKGIGVNKALELSEKFKKT